MTLAIGCRFAEVGTGSYGLQPPGKLIHVDIDGSVLGKNYQTELPLVADSGSFISAMLPRLAPRKIDEKLRQSIRRGHEEVWNKWEAPAESERVAPPHLLKTLQTIIGPDAIYTTDSGNGTFLAIECLRLQQPPSFLAPVDYSRMGTPCPQGMERSNTLRIGSNIKRLLRRICGLIQATHNQGSSPLTGILTTIGGSADCGTSKPPI